jgi:N-acetylglucosaminyldiphosphoundecaprenol N-acetyl-beta-D-mannosaminyltransferase
MARTATRRIHVFEADIDPLTMEQTLDEIDWIIQRQVPTQHSVVNVAKLVMMRKDSALREAVNSCQLVNADGQGIVWGARLLGLRIPERVTGIDLFEELLARAAMRGYRVYLLGATREVIEEVVRRVRRQHPGLQIAGYRDGYYPPEDEAAVADAIRRADADMLFVGMSSPRKEVFLHRHHDRMQVPFTMGVGGSFDVIAGRVRRAPKWMQRMGLEWSFRLLCEPRRMWKRYLVTNTVFLSMLLRALMTGRRNAACR